MDSSKDKADVSKINSNEESKGSFSARPNFLSNLEDDMDDFSANAFKWTNGEFLPSTLKFLPEEVGFSPGVVNSLVNKTPFKCFLVFVDKKMIKLIVKQTNLYAEQVKDNSAVGNKRDNNYKQATMSDIYVFLGLTLLMAHITKNKIQDYWAIDEYLSTPIFPRLMARDRYWELWSYFHFNDNSLNANASRLFKVELIVSHLQAKFSEVLKPFQNLCIDKLLLLFKGRLKFKQ